MAEIKKIGALSLAKINGVMGIIVGLIFGIVYGVLLLFVSPAWGLAAIILAPLGYGIFSFISGLIGAWLYNLVAGWVGGIELELKK